MRGFESFPATEPTEPEGGNRDKLKEVDEKSESVIEDRDMVYARLSRVAKRAIVVTMIGLGVGYGVKGIEESAEYNKHIDSQGAVVGENFKQAEVELKDEIGRNVRFIKIGDEKAFSERNDERTPPKISGCEEVGLSEKVVGELLIEGTFFPKGFINGEVSEVNFHVGPGPTLDRYGLDEKSSAGEYDITSRTDFYFDKSQLGSKARELYDYFELVFAHEVGHANDWEESHNLNRLDRAQLLGKIVERVKSKDALDGISTYHSEIKIEDKEDQLYAKAKEYWAELVCNYLIFPEWLQKEHPEDFQIVDEIVKKSDPTFDPIKANQERKAFLNSEVARQQYLSPAP